MMGRTLLSVLIPSLALLAAGSGLRAARARGIFPVYDGTITSPRCSCHCCVVERRRPDEAGGQHLSKCAAPANLGGTCSSECTAVDDEVFTHVTIVDMDRYCFHRCQPEGTLQPSEKVALAEKFGGSDSYHGGFSVDAACIKVPHSLENLAMEPTGNGKDHLLPEAIPDLEVIQQR
mmetsp:Transcript_18423/g.43227  ORF Transcript_18423/g.43227 Transcript_18423/m.43227 type:complete len:176 (+) Transcript_18423:52-579(+)